MAKAMSSQQAASSMASSKQSGYHQQKIDPEFYKPGKVDDLEPSVGFTSEPSKSKRSLAWWTIRVSIVLVALLLLLALILGLVFGIRSAQQHQEASVQASIAKFGIDGDQGETSQSSTSGADSSKRCMKHCYDRTYVACACDDVCDCPRDRVSITVNNDNRVNQQQQAPSSAPSFLSPITDLFSSAASAASSTWDSWSWRSETITSSSDELCIALCAPDFTPQKVDCDHLLSACDG